MQSGYLGVSVCRDSRGHVQSELFETLFDRDSITKHAIGKTSNDFDLLVDRGSIEIPKQTAIQKFWRCFLIEIPKQLYDCKRLW